MALEHGAHFEHAGLQVPKLEATLPVCRALPLEPNPARRLDHRPGRRLTQPGPDHTRESRHSVQANGRELVSEGDAHIDGTQRLVAVGFDLQDVFARLESRELEDAGCLLEATLLGSFRAV